MGSAFPARLGLALAAGIALNPAAHARALPACEPSIAEPDSFTGWIRTIDPIAARASREPPPEFLKALARKDPDLRAKHFAAGPTSRTCSSATFRFPGEIELQPNEAAYLAMPEDLRSRSVITTLMNHRQDRGTPSNQNLQEGQHDSAPGLTSVQLHLAQETVHSKSWRHYQADTGASGQWGAKFAEVRSPYDPELEGMGSWRQHGHIGIRDDEASSAPLTIDALRLVSVGVDPVRISAITVKVAPPKADRTIEKIFTPGTRFEDFDTGDGQVLAGGESFQGKYPGALSIGGFSPPKPPADLPSGWKVTGNQLVIPAVPGYRITAVEVATGDMRDDGQKNKDGSTGSLGWAKLSIDLRSASGQVIETLMRRENVPKEGVLIGYPTQCERASVAGEEVVIRSDDDVAKIMGVRVHLQKAP